MLSLPHRWKPQPLGRLLGPTLPAHGTLFGRLAPEWYFQPSLGGSHGGMATPGFVVPGCEIGSLGCML